MVDQAMVEVVVGPMKQLIYVVMVVVAVVFAVAVAVAVAVVEGEVVVNECLFFVA
mgnify:CR=1 FL=1